LTPKTPIRVVGLCGSLRPTSTTRHALRVALEGAAQAGASIALLDLRTYQLPFCDGNENEEAYPQDVFRLRRDVASAHGVVLGTPEYHGSYSGVLKNALDLMGFDEFEGKMVGLVGVSGGQLGAVSALHEMRNVARALHAWVVPAQAGVPRAGSAFDASGAPLDARLADRLRDVGREVARFAYLHHAEEAKAFLQAWETATPNPGGVHQGPPP